MCVCNWRIIFYDVFVLWRERKKKLPGVEYITPRSVEDAAHLLSEAENSTSSAASRVTSMEVLIQHASHPSPDNEVVMRLPCPGHLPKHSQNGHEARGDLCNRLC